MSASAQGFHVLVRQVLLDQDVSLRSIDTSTKPWFVTFHGTRQVSPSSLLSARVLSGAICCINEPVGTLKPKCEEYAYFPYLASVALRGQGQNCPAERRKWWFG